MQSKLLYLIKIQGAYFSLNIKPDKYEPKVQTKIMRVCTIGILSMCAMWHEFGHSNFGSLLVIPIVSASSRRLDKYEPKVLPIYVHKWKNFGIIDDVEIW